MNQNAKVAIRVEYEVDGVRKVCIGEIEETKLENFDGEEENHILMENDGYEFWKDKVSIFSIDRLEVQSTIYEKSRVNIPTKNNTEICT